MIQVSTTKLYTPTNVQQAVEQLADLNGQAIPVAGATWVMRAPIRGEHDDRAFVSLAQISELHQINVEPHQLEIGAMATHEALAAQIETLPDLAHLHQAATQSANGSIRRTATIGGNIAANGFMASDILPALLASEATLTIASPQGMSNVEIADYLTTRTKRSFSEIITKITLKRGRFIGTHQRLLMRKMGEYPVANLSMILGLGDDQKIKTARLAVGSVEALPKRWAALEVAILDVHPNDLDITLLADQHAKSFKGRDGGDAPGWYRTRVLKSLAARAFEAVAQQAGNQ